MIDRITFDQFNLQNGIMCFVNPVRLDYTTVHIQIPRGTAHNVESFLPGTFHFLEHLCCDRSKLHPQLDQYDEIVGLTGGHSNASTASFMTSYYISAPDNRIDELLPGLFSRAFEPIIDEDNINKQRTIIANERRRKERWFPGSDERSWYEQTQWKNGQRFSLEQVFGSDSDLKAMNRDMLYQAHETYKSPGIRVIVMGAADIKPLLKLLEVLSLTERTLPSHFALTSWQDKSFRVKHFRDVGRHSLTIGGIIQPAPDMQTERQLRFIMNYLINSTHGALHNWLRRDLGWSYGLSAESGVDQYELDWEMDFPVNSLPQVEQIRREWRARSEAALADQTSVNLEVDRLLGSSAYWNSNPQSLLGSAVRDLSIYDRVVTDTERRQMIESCRNSATLQRLFAEYWSPEVLGEYCSAPEITK